MNKESLRGYIVFGWGFFLILINGLGYILRFGLNSPALSIMGLIFVILGLTLRKNSK